MTKVYGARNLRTAILTVCLLFVAGSAGAVDGIIEINQAKAVAGSVTAPDGPGFPVTIGSPGSYRLTGNLRVSTPDTSAIYISAENVTVDLNGFQIYSTGGGTAAGVYATHHEVRIHNGTVASFGGKGIHMEGDSAVVENVRVVGNGDDGVALTGDGGMVSQCTARGNGGNGIWIAGGGLVTTSSSRDNVSNGIWAGAGNTITGNAVASNGGSGIYVTGACSVIGNTATSNGEFGLDLTSSSGYGNNVMDNNTDGDVALGLEMGGNVCSSSTICVAIVMTREN
jgi:hypothetical protein